MHVGLRSRAPFLALSLRRAPAHTVASRLALIFVPGNRVLCCLVTTVRDFTRLESQIKLPKDPGLSLGGCIMLGQDSLRGPLCTLPTGASVVHC